MRVVSNTSPLVYLLLIQEIRILPCLFSEVLIPEAVRGELAHPDAPIEIRNWIEQPPNWISTAQLSTYEEDSDLQRVDPGEREAILLAEQRNADLLLLDDRKARQVARRRGLPLTGLVGVLRMAIARDLVDASAVVARLRATTFRVSDALLEALLR
jgi:predicted nucleic acid-binding protein